MSSNKLVRCELSPTFKRRGRTRAPNTRAKGEITMISLRQAEQIFLAAPRTDCVIASSAPGTGKSSIVARAARRAAAHYWQVYAATYEAVDARGLPYVYDANAHKSVGWAAPSCLPLATDADKYQGREVWVNLDDLFQAPPPVQRAFVRCIYGDGVSR